MADDYEAQFMGGESAALHREKIVWRWGAALFAASSVFALGISGMIFALDPSPVALVPLLPATALGGAALLFSVLRVTVTGDRLHVQLGPAGPAIALDRIDSIEVRRYPWERYGGWGVRLGIDGSWAYSIPGVARGVRIAWRDERGRSHVSFVSSREPEQLAEAIARARGASASRAAPDRAEPMGVRVAIEPGEADEPVHESNEGAADPRRAAP